MYELEVPIRLQDGTETTQTETVYSIDDAPIADLLFAPTCRGRNKTYLNISAAFDIEATTIEESKTPEGFMYQWQICIQSIVIFGRTWEEFTKFLDILRDTLQLSESRILVMYVHNLAYEYQFTHNFLSITSMFSKDKRKPMYITTPGIEFRCSYFLSNMSLSKFCENSELCTHYKLTDTYEYSKLRTPDTPLTIQEQGYCYNDVRGLCECIDTLLMDDTIATIPLTNTGFVRREARIAMAKNPENRKTFEKTALDLEQYTLLTEAFRGGNTHANRYKAGRVFQNVGSYDKQSSYPGNMLMKYFPVGKFSFCNIETQEKLDEYCAKYCVVMRVSFLDIEAHYNNVIPYIPISKCVKRSNVVNDNGRVLSATYIQMTITEIDLAIIRRTYKFTGFIVERAMYASRGLLPVELRETILKYYEMKTTLKNVQGKEYEYMRSKNRLNSLFGMMVSAMIHDEIIVTNGEWKCIPDDPQKAIEKYYKSRNSFLSYQWGVYVTAHARDELQDGIDLVGSDCIYCDTDSVKFVNDHSADFEAINITLMLNAEKADIPALCHHNGKTYHMGVWEDEGNGEVAYKEFKTLGAKKYCYTDKKGFHITVSGMHKKKGAKEVAEIENFQVGKTFSNVGRTVSYYNEAPIHKTTIDGCTFTTSSNIGVIDTTYTLGITHEYWQIIEGLYSNIDEPQKIDDSLNMMYYKRVPTNKQTNKQNERRQQKCQK